MAAAGCLNNYGGEEKTTQVRELNNDKAHTELLALLEEIFRVLCC